MMTQSVKTQLFGLVSNSNTGKSASVKPVSQGKDFNSVMDSNLKANNNTGNLKEETAGMKDTNPSVNNNQPDPAKQPVNVSETVKTPGDQKAESGNEISQGKNVLGEDDNNSQFLEKVQDILASLQNTITSTLGIRKEDLEKAMETLGLSAIDLLNPDNLKQLVLQVNGTNDISDALTNETIAKSLNDLNQAVNQLLNESSLKLSKEELESLKEQLQSKGPQLNPEPVPDKAPKQEAVSSNAQESSITLEVHKEQEPGSQQFNTEAGAGKGHAEQRNKVDTPSPLETFIQNLAVKGNEDTFSFTEQIANVRQMQDITNQIVEQIKIMIKPEQTSMELQLNPESLGKINLSVVAKDGILTAHFTAQNEIAKEAIESQMQLLKDNLNNQGLKVDAIEVTVSNFAFSQSNQTSGGDSREQKSHNTNRNMKRDDISLFSAEEEEETTPLESLEQTGSSIDYTA